MPLTPSASIALGTKAPPFYLPNPQGHRIGLHDFPEAKAVLIAFISDRLPHVRMIREAFAIHQTPGIGGNIMWRPGNEPRCAPSA
ncbi:hypothetical protein [Azospirillum tabaci]|uniref:hypothetical protein n=1 Tax=Azospirillum tabaci TaxID=2752310 RepID=UPI0016617E07|nr:hypothetical protein [Azospirillum tabaci]